jgi:hypothetical protein
MSYHNGSVWPHDNALIGMGLSHYGFRKQAARILHGLYEASVRVELHRLPELFCGFHKRPESSGPTLYPVACAPQAWAAGSVFLLLRACLGLDARAHERQLCSNIPYSQRTLNKFASRICGLEMRAVICSFSVTDQELRLWKSCEGGANWKLSHPPETRSGVCDLEGEDCVMALFLANTEYM